MVFGTFAYLKNVEKLIVSLRGGSYSQAKIYYSSDYEEERKDETDIDTMYEYEADFVVAPCSIAVRKPKCNNVHQFTVTLSNNEPSDMAITAMQVFYTYRGMVRAGVKI